MTTTTQTYLAMTGAAPAGGHSWQWLETALGWYDRQRERRQLAGLDERMLKDIGISRDLVEAETRKPFWTA